MKSTRSKIGMAACLSVLTAFVAIKSPADQTATAAQPEKNYTGTIVSVDPQEHTLKAKWFLFTKKFNLGDDCVYTLLDKNPATAGDLRPGEKIAVNYQDANGVLIADRVEQLPMRYDGMVESIDTNANTLTLHLSAMDKTFQIANDCGVTLRDDKSGTLDDIKVGDHVTVTYETPNDKLVARQITQTSSEFTGTLTAVDLNDRTLKAKAMFDTEKFNVGDNCAIVIDGKPDGKLADLRLNDKLVLSYDKINGVNVVNRIAPADEQENSTAMTTSTMGN